jgi:diaminopropionate ammonia-lyase
MRFLADTAFEGRHIVAGESAVAGLAGLIFAANEPEVRREINLNGDSCVLLIGTEGDTDPELYRRLVSTSEN